MPRYAVNCRNARRKNKGVQKFTLLFPPSPCRFPLPFPSTPLIFPFHPFSLPFPNPARGLGALPTKVWGGAPAEIELNLVYFK